MSRLNCRPGDLARVVTPGPFQDKIIRVTRVDQYFRGRAIWGYEPPHFEFAIGVQTGFFDDVLRPIRDPGDDARDETLSWLDIPVKQGETV